METYLVLKDLAIIIVFALLLMYELFQKMYGFVYSLVNEISPDTMYSTIKEEKFVVNLSEEILEVITLNI